MLFFILKHWRLILLLLFLNDGQVNLPPSTHIREPFFEFFSLSGHLPLSGSLRCRLQFFFGRYRERIVDRCGTDSSQMFFAVAVD